MHLLSQTHIHKKKEMTEKTSQKRWGGFFFGAVPFVYRGALCFQPVGLGLNWCGAFGCGLRAAGRFIAFSTSTHDLRTKRYKLIQKHKNNEATTKLRKTKKREYIMVYLNGETSQRRKKKNISSL